MLELTLLKAGYCDAYEHHAIRGGRPKLIAFDGVFALLKHPERGYLLFDTGYARRFFSETAYYPEKIYAQITAVHIREEEEAVHQLHRLGIGANEVRHVIISHFHADHVCGLKDFPSATFHCTRRAYEQISRRRGWAAVRKGLLPGLLPDDFTQRLSFIDQCPVLQHPIFERAYDLFGDGLIQLVDLSGHAAGQAGALLETTNGKVFLAADACWLSRSYREMILPHPIVRLFFDSWSEYQQNLQRLHDFHQAYPEYQIIPTHCNATTTPLITKP